MSTRTHVSKALHMLVSYAAPRGVIADLLARAYLGSPWAIRANGEYVTSAMWDEYYAAPAVVYALADWQRSVAFAPDAITRWLKSGEDVLILPLPHTTNRHAFPAGFRLNDGLPVQSGEKAWVSVSPDGVSVYALNGALDDFSLTKKMHEYLFPIYREMLADINALPAVQYHIGGIMFWGVVMDNHFVLVGGEDAFAEESQFTPTNVNALRLSGMFEEAAIPELILPEDAIPFFRGEQIIPGAASGRLIFSAEDAEAYDEATPLILVHTPPNIRLPVNMERLSALLTFEVGGASHAAIFAKQRGIPCIHVPDMQLEDEQVKLPSGAVLTKGDLISIDRGGNFYRGFFLTTRTAGESAMRRAIESLPSIVTRRVYLSINTPDDMTWLLTPYINGVGLFRSEQLYAPNSDLLMAAARVAYNTGTQNDEDAVRAAHTEAYKRLLSYPLAYVVIRLFDPSFNEFSPLPPDIQRFVRDTNPAMGLRGARLYLNYPRFMEVQVEAILDAFAQVRAAGNVVPTVVILLPMISAPYEMAALYSQIKTMLPDNGMAATILIGAMIETPSALTQMPQIAQYADVLSIGTNDLMQFMQGIGRDDAHQIFHGIPAAIYRWGDSGPSLASVTADVRRSLLKNITKTKRQFPNTVIGYCGSHTDPRLIATLLTAQVDYISVSVADYMNTAALVHTLTNAPNVSYDYDNDG